MPAATQPWLHDLPVMQQSVVLSAIRGPDGAPKHHKAKALIRWFRRCVLISAFDGTALTDPTAPGGGSFTGPIGTLRDWTDSGRQSFTYPNGNWEACIKHHVDDFLDSRDELPFHYYTHAMHAFQILGAKHPDQRIATFWSSVYVRMVNALHVHPETTSEMDARLGDNEAGWQARNDPSSTCSD